MARTVSPEFTAAYDRARYIKNANNEELLNLYAYAKIAKQEEDIKTAPAPGMFDLAGKAKRKRWQQHVDESVSPEDAEKQYIAAVAEMVGKYGLKDTCPENLKI